MTAHVTIPCPMPSAKVNLMGVDFDALTEAQAVEHVAAELTAGRGGWIVTPNLDHLRRCTKGNDFRNLVAKADLIVADGMPLIWAAKLQGTPLPERVAGSSMVTTLAAMAERDNRSIFLLGGDEGAADGAAHALRQRFPKIRIAGTHYPPFGFEKDETQMQAIRDALRDARPDLIYVALGSPKQEQLIDTLKSELPGAWWAGIGISLSFLAGHVRRAPHWMQKCGLEWLHRLAQEPARLAKRYLLQGIPFVIQLLTRAILNRFKSNKV